MTKQQPPTVQQARDDLAEAVAFAQSAFDELCASPKSQEIIALLEKSALADLALLVAVKPHLHLLAAEPVSPFVRALVDELIAASNRLCLRSDVKTNVLFKASRA